MLQELKHWYKPFWGHVEFFGCMLVLVTWIIATFFLKGTWHEMRALLRKIRKRERKDATKSITDPRPAANPNRPEIP